MPGTWQVGRGLCECLRVECKLAARGDCGASAVRGPAVWLASWAHPARMGGAPLLRGRSSPLCSRSARGPGPALLRPLGHCSGAGAPPLAHPTALCGVFTFRRRKFEGICVFRRTEGGKETGRRG